MPLPQPYYLISALKQANHKTQHSAGVLGGLSSGGSGDTNKIISLNYRWMLEDLTRRLRRYEQHFRHIEDTKDLAEDESYGGTASSEQFLHSEYDVLRRIAHSLHADLPRGEAARSEEEL